jgi:hypothetical protein
VPRGRKCEREHTALAVIGTRNPYSCDSLAPLIHTMPKNAGNFGTLRQNCRFLLGKVGKKFARSPLPNEISRLSCLLFIVYGNSIQQILMWIDLAIG